MKSSKMPRPFVVWSLVILDFIMAVGGVVSGGELALAPDGKYLGMSTDLLENSPFVDYLVPGLILVAFIGFYPVLAGFGLLRKPAWNWLNVINPFKQYHWSWSASWAFGVIMLIWIVVEYFLVGYISFLQPAVVVWGLVTIGLTLLPATRRYCSLSG